MSKLVECSGSGVGGNFSPYIVVCYHSCGDVRCQMSHGGSNESYSFRCGWNFPSLVSDSYRMLHYFIDRHRMFRVPGTVPPLQHNCSAHGVDRRKIAPVHGDKGYAILSQALAVAGGPSPLCPLHFFSRETTLQTIIPSSQDYGPRHSPGPPEWIIIYNGGWLEVLESIINVIFHVTRNQSLRGDMPSPRCRPQDGQV